MRQRNFIQVFEYQKLRYEENSDFEEHHFDAMVHFNEKNNNKYFNVIHRGIQFNNYVGVIQIGGLTIEILPKVDRDSSNSEHQKIVWQSVLLNMLKVCKHINVDNVSESNLKKRSNSILEVYFEMYLDEIDGLIKRGLIKKYRRVQSNQLALKGNLVFSQNIQKNIVHKERFYCEHQVYDKEHLLNLILFKGLLILKGLLNNNLRDKLNRILFEFKDFKEVEIKSNHFDKIKFRRKNLPYLKALEIAKMIILNYSPNLNSGNTNMLTLLFDMNMLWEEYIFRVLQKHKPESFTVSFQNKKDFWSNDIGTKTIRPDIVITKDETDGSDSMFVIDTKWKIRSSENPDDDDLKQMFVYNLYWKAEKSLLLFPKTNQSDSSFGNYNYRSKRLLESKLEDLPNQCKLGFVNIVGPKGILPGEILAEEIFKKLD